MDYDTAQQAILTSSNEYRWANAVVVLLPFFMTD